ncbi:MAG: isoprenylcysteine carboxylmethyltransferase family protein [Desulfobaccales bacterium]
MADLAAIYKDKSPSLGPKATLVGIHLLVVVIVVWLLLGSGAAVLENLFGRSLHLASNLRRGALATAAVLYFLRTLATVFVFLKRRMTWSEVGAIALWVALIDVLFAYFGGRHEGSFGLTEVVGVVLVLVGSAINSGAELQRHLWKQRSENAGHLYTGGLFRYARHINYFGDVVLFTGWVLMTGQPGLLIIPVIMAFLFIFGNIPALDRYLKDRYGDEYRVYARTVKRFIPYVY